MHATHMLAVARGALDFADLVNGIAQLSTVCVVETVELLVWSRKSLKDRDARAQLSQTCVRRRNCAALDGANVVYTMLARRFGLSAIAFIVCIEYM